MSDGNLSQSEADALIAMEKRREDDTLWSFPRPGASVIIPLVSADSREGFLLDVGRGGINIAKCKYQNRARKLVILVRLEIEGPTHQNPDGTEVPCPHLHMYREGYGDKWAYPVPAGQFPNLTDIWLSMHDFMAYCNVVDPPLFQGGLVL